MAKAGFYWHFRNRADLLEDMQAYWAHEFTEVVTANPEILDLPPAQRLLAIMQMVDEYGLTSFDLHFRAWAKNDPAVARGVREVIKVRLDTVRALFSELGFEGEDLGVRAHLFVCYGSNEGDMFGGRGGTPQRDRELYWRLLIGMATVMG